jgi:outer membrane protein TolC
MMMGNMVPGNAVPRNHALIVRPLITPLRVRFIAGAIVAAWCGSLTISAQEAQAPQDALPSAATRLRVEEPERRLTLSEAVDLAVSRSLQAEVSRNTVAVARQAITVAEGAFDPVLQFRPAFESTQVPVASVLQAPGGRLLSRGINADFAFVQPLRHGTTVSVSFENGRTASNNAFTSLDPYFRSGLSVGLTQPLLRGLRSDERRAQVRIRQQELTVSQMSHGLQLTDIVSSVEDAYWDLLVARQEAEVRGEAVQVGERHLAVTRRLVHGGDLAQVEVAAAEAELARRRDDFEASLGRTGTAENRLKALLSTDISDPLWAEEIVPLHAAASPRIPELDVRALVERALSERFELREMDPQRRIVETGRQLAAEDRLPRVDLTVSYMRTGLSGVARGARDPFTASTAALYERTNELSRLAGVEPLAVQPPGVGVVSPLGGYPRTFSNMLNGSDHSVRVGLNIDLNLRDRGTGARLAQANLATRQVELERNRRRQAVNQQVRDAVQAITVARQRVAAAEAGARAAEESAASEARRFAAGESTNFMVLTRQNEYSESRLRLAAATIDLTRAAASLERAVGTTLRAYGIEVAAR